MNAYWYSIQWGFKPRLNKVKPPADATDFQRKFIELKLDKIWAQIRQGAFDPFIKTAGSLRHIIFE
ncbi:hypothetical protein J22TS1_46740 [Siminovitchia terrae]|uniref:Uncharacterized protein n=1 Tax=Siminovitchia terrae TaxID=1914933 RepID=A0A429X979_SIMTE|nr:hypothetical protein [Siminovitchia terrae]RST59984.1 hypothetical protein D5F11_009815 [Siminovitchia terrae]GIN93623.1 hypothetical protein J22TS1_46740 [Siminovitchia terrae]